MICPACGLAVQDETKVIEGRTFRRTICPDFEANPSCETLFAWVSLDDVDENGVRLAG